ncbi:WXG100 family type VII secretion target [Streptomyces sp. NBC_01803]|uniref:WXG100 family type VII secretion target n=1 Tax=Streptomyces sp. NBC_01803 TaxID=2975946 RepID=UPI002DDB395A|nr:WXG100 family type VII secretion target [Streptomyces sp. NBC_01803]WSA43915.1 WXG100 family type VII secretion target [Streptomyces sp. NBC_01803]
MTDFNLSVNYAALGAGSEGMSRTERELLNRMEELQASLRQVAAGWEGEAMRAFDANMRVLNEELDKLRMVLAQTGNQLSNAIGDYQRTDRAGARLLGG